MTSKGRPDELPRPIPPTGGQRLPDVVLTKPDGSTITAQAYTSLEGGAEDDGDDVLICDEPVAFGGM